MMAEIPMSGWREWLAFADREPWGPSSWDQRIGWCLAILVEAITGKRVSPDQMTPKWGAAKAADWRTMRAKMIAWGKAQNADHR